MMACSVGSAIDERLQPNRNVRFFRCYRTNTGRSADDAKATQMTYPRRQGRMPTGPEIVCLSGKSGSGRATVKATRMTQNSHPNSVPRLEQVL